MRLLLIPHIHQKCSSVLALIAVVLMFTAQAMSHRHIMESVTSLRSGEVMVCTQFGPMKVALDSSSNPAGPLSPKQVEHCPTCAGAATPVLMLAASLLGLFDSDDQPQRLSSTYAYSVDFCPDRRHAPPHAPPVLS